MKLRLAELAEFAALSLLVLGGCLSSPGPRFAAEDPLRGMTLEEKVGQLFVVSANGVFYSDDAPGYLALEKLVKESRVGGVIYFRSSVLEAASLTARLQKSARIPLLVSADLEAGLGMRFPDVVYGPWAMAVAATGDPSLARRRALVTAQESRALGLHQVFAPVADVNVDPDNPVINVRSYGEDPAQVSRYVEATVQGLQEGGVTATLKHFPGHGDTHTDSHLTLPVVASSAERLDRVELVPFRAGIAAGARSVMVGHLSVPALDEAPATLSRPVVTGLLRGKMGFDGLVVTDAMTMKALSLPPAEASVRAIEAGIDMVLMSPDTAGSIAAVVAAVRSGRIEESRIDASARRVLGEKERLGLFRQTAPSPALLPATVGTRPHAAVEEEIARRSLTLVREEEGALPIDRKRSLAVISVLDEGTPALEEPLLAELRKRSGLPVAAVRIDPRATDAEIAEGATAVGKADQVLLALFVRARSGSGTVAVPRSGAEAIRQVLTAAKGGGKRVVAISFGSPYLLRDFPALATYLAAWGSQEVVQGAAAAALLGEQAIGGRLPVTIPGVATRGAGIDRPAASRP
jgi:beta-N-acetylhexosaminidase